MKALSFSREKEFCFNFGERPILSSVKRIFELFVFFGQALLLERQVFGTTWVFLFVLYLFVLYQLRSKYHMKSESIPTKPQWNKILLCWVLCFPGIVALRKVLAVRECISYPSDVDAQPRIAPHLLVSRSYPLKHTKMKSKFYMKYMQMRWWHVW